MKKSNLLKSLFLVSFLCLGMNASAQGFFKKLGNAAKSVVSTTSKTTDESATETSAATAATDSAKVIAWDSIPNYEPKILYVTDDNGDTIKRADGTYEYRVVLQDQFGNIRSAKVVEEQHAKIKKTVNTIWTKIGVGAAAGALGGLMSKGKVKDAAIGAGAGAALGVLASIGDISNVKKMRKALKEQDKKLAEYQKNITDEGVPKDASVDLTKVKDLGLKDDNSLSMTASQVQALLESDSYNDASNASIDELVNVADEISKEQKA